MGILLFVAFLALLFLGTPIAIAIGLPAFLVIWLAELGTPVIAPNFFAGIAKFPLLAIPLFILAGFIFERCGISQRIVHFANILVGRRRGGLAIVAIGVCVFFGGMLIDAVSILYIFLPIFIPIIHHYGWDPIWFGVIMTLNLAIGQFTPPVAVNLYVTTQLANIRLEKTFKAVWPMVISMLVALLIVIAFPSLSLFVPHFFGLQ